MKRKVAKYSKLANIFSFSSERLKDEASALFFSVSILLLKSLLLDCFSNQSLIFSLSKSINIPSPKLSIPGKSLVFFPFEVVYFALYYTFPGI